MSTRDNMKALSLAIEEMVDDGDEMRALGACVEAAKRSENEVVQVIGEMVDTVIQATLKEMLP